MDQTIYFDGRGRNAGFPAPPAQIPACAPNAPGSYLGFWRQSVALGVGAEYGLAGKSAPGSFCTWAKASGFSDCVVATTAASTMPPC